MDDDAPPAPENAPRCGFCGRLQHSVRKLIVGPGCAICDDCLELCCDLLAVDHGAAAGEAGGA